MQPNLHK